MTQDNIPRSFQLVVAGRSDQSYKYRIGIPSIFKIEAVGWTRNTFDEDQRTIESENKPTEGQQIVMAEPRTHYGLYLRLVVNGCQLDEWSDRQINWLRIPERLELKNIEYLVANPYYSDQWFYDIVFRGFKQGANNVRLPFMYYKTIYESTSQMGFWDDLQRELPISKIGLGCDSQKIFHLPGKHPVALRDNQSKNLNILGGSTSTNENGMFVCSKCPEKFTNEFWLEIHDLIVHPIENVRVDVIDNNEVISLRTPQKNIASTSKPRRTLASISKSRNRRYVSPVPGAINVSTRSLCEQSANTLTCLVCCRIFKTQIQQDRHMRNHLRALKYRCDVCCEYFERYLEMVNHRSAHYKYPHICEVCDADFVTLEKMLRHRNNKHGVLENEQP